MRRVEPHHYGTLDGGFQLHAFQIGGGSQSGNIPEWKNFKVTKIKTLTIDKSSSFTPRDTYNPGNSNYTDIQNSINQSSAPRPRK